MCLPYFTCKHDQTSSVFALYIAKFLWIIHRKSNDSWKILFFTTPSKSCLAKLKSPILLLKFLLMPKYIITYSGGSIKTNGVYNRVKSALSGRQKTLDSQACIHGKNKQTKWSVTSNSINYTTPYSNKSL